MTIKNCAVPTRIGDGSYTPMGLCFVLFAALVLSCLPAVSQESSLDRLPSVNLMNARGVVINTGDLSTDSTPVVICFWATWCKPCIQELQTYNGLIEEWKEQTGVQLYAVTIDDSRNAQKVPSFVKGRNWKFDVLLDVNGDFRRAMNVNNIPHTFLVQNGKIIWQHTSYAAGDEDDLFERILHIKTTPVHE